MYPPDPELRKGAPDSGSRGPALRPVLLIDDDPDAIFLIRRSLERAGVEHPVIAFNDSADALAFLRGFTEEPASAAQKPCAIFLDIKMPKVHGFVLLKWVRQQAVLDDVHVVMLSGSEEPSDRLRTGKLGADDYLVKYPPPEVLADAVAVASGMTRASSP